jgi:hypothetical protein
VKWQQRLGIGLSNQEAQKENAQTQTQEDAESHSLATTN